MPLIPPCASYSVVGHPIVVRPVVQLSPHLEIPSVPLHQYLLGMRPFTSFCAGLCCRPCRGPLTNRIQCLTSNSVHFTPRIRRRSIPSGMVLNCSQSSGSGTFLFLLLGLPLFSDYCWCTRTALLPRGYFLCYSPIIVPTAYARSMVPKWSSVSTYHIISYQRCLSLPEFTDPNLYLSRGCMRWTIRAAQMVDRRVMGECGG